MTTQQSSKSTPSFAVWAIADLHLSFGVKDKKMDIFGKEWANWTDKIEHFWTEKISAHDLVLLPGDISWAMYPKEAVPDLEWIDRLPGTKLLIRGNHDYWWGSKRKVESILPSSLHIIQNDAFHFHQVSVGGVRLWDTPEYNFNDFIILKENQKANALTMHAADPSHDEKIFLRELSRLEMSLQELNAEASHRIVMTHYPPIGANLKTSRASQLLEKYRVDISVFGHLHSLRPDSLPFGKKNGVTYHLTSCDYLGFNPLQIL
jgi:uncharacterized protein